PQRPRARAHPPTPRRAPPSCSSVDPTSPSCPPAARGTSRTSGVSAPLTDGLMMDKRTYLHGERQTGVRCQRQHPLDCEVSPGNLPVSRRGGEPPEDRDGLDVRSEQHPIKFPLPGGGSVTHHGMVDHLTIGSPALRPAPALEDPAHRGEPERRHLGTVVAR